MIRLIDKDNKHSLLGVPFLEFVTSVEDYGSTVLFTQQKKPIVVYKKIGETALTIAMEEGSK